MNVSFLSQVAAGQTDGHPLIGVADINKRADGKLTAADLIEIANA